jgi:ribonuclease T
VKYSISDRFRGFLPVVVDVETAGFNAKTDALLEIAAVIIQMDSEGRVFPGETHHAHVEPFPGANLEQSALDFTGIDPYHPFRMAVTEQDALGEIFGAIRKAVKHSGCTRAIMVAHNPIFDMGFVNAAVERCGIKRNPFHPFSSFDTVTLGGLAYGQTVLARIAEAAGIKWNESAAHSAIYDAERTAEIFCTIVNKWDSVARPEAVTGDEL